MARLGPRHEIDIARTEPLGEFGTVATDIDAQAYAEGVGKLLTDEVLGAQRLAVIVVIGLRAAQGGHDQLAVGLDISEVEIL